MKIYDPYTGWKTVNEANQNPRQIERTWQFNGRMPSGEEFSQEWDDVDPRYMSDEEIAQRIEWVLAEAESDGFTDVFIWETTDEKKV